MVYQEGSEKSHLLAGHPGLVEGLVRRNLASVPEQANAQLGGALRQPVLAALRARGAVVRGSQEPLKVRRNLQRMEPGSQWEKLSHCFRMPEGACHAS